MIVAGATAAASAVALLVLSFVARDVALPRLDVTVFAARARRALGRDRAGPACVAIMQATHAGLRAQLPLVAALRGALEPQPVAARAPFEAVLRAIALNDDLDTAVARVRGGVSDRRVITALDALVLASREDLSAVRASALVASVAERLAFEANLRAEVDARASGARTQIVILALVVPCFALYLVATLPGLAATLASPIGAHVLIPIAVFLEITGVIMSRSIVAGLEL